MTRFQYCCYCSVAKLCPTLCDPMDCSMPGFPVFTISRRLLKLMSTELMMPSNNPIPCHPLLLMPSILSSIKVFSNESAVSIRWPRYWTFSFSISPFSEYSGLISFRIDSFDLLAVQGTLQHHNLEAPILSHSAFFMVHFSHLYMTTGKTIAFIIQTFVGKVMSLLFYYAV